MTTCDELRCCPRCGTDIEPIEDDDLALLARLADSYLGHLLEEHPDHPIVQAREGQL